MLKIAICDDDLKFAGKFETMLFAIAKQKHMNVDIDVFINGRELVESLYMEEKAYDLIFLDIEMKELDGLATAKQIRQTDDITMLIYVTSHISYAIDAYEVQPFQFLVKPVKVEMLHRYFLKAYDKLTKGPTHFFCQFGGNTDNLIMNDIMYFKSSKRIINIYMVDGSTYKFYGKLKELEECLQQKKVDFWRIHQSYLVNVRHISRISHDEVELRNHKVLYISEDRRKKISEIYCDYIKENIIE